MIFVTVGSQKFQFNRLLIEIDELIEIGIIKEEVFAQIGYSDYKPKNYKYKEFLDRKEFSEVMDRCDSVITHGGTGAIIGAIKRKKKVIAAARLKKFKEHVDDHQVQIVNQFKNIDFIIAVKEIEELEKAIKKKDYFNPKEYVSNTNNIICDIDQFIKN